MKNSITPSITMQAVCAVRADNPEFSGHDPLAKKILNFLPEARTFRDQLDQFSQGNFTRTVLLRSKYFFHSTLNCIEKTEQIVIFCSGLDYRFINYAESSNKSIFLIDYPASLELAMQLSNKVLSTFKHIKTLPIDLNYFDQTTFFLDLIQKGFNPKLSTLFIWEGASYYFSPDIVFSILKIISQLADKSYLLVDFANEGSFLQKNSDENVCVSRDEVKGVKNTLNMLKERQEPWKGFINSETIKQFLKQLGFDTYINWDYELETEYFGEAKMKKKSMYYINAFK